MNRRANIPVSRPLWLTLGAAMLASGFSEFSDRVPPNLEHPAIRYSRAEVHDPVSELNRKLEKGTAQLKFDGPQGYLRPVLDALHVPVESQIAIFSKTSLQSDLIERNNPRTLFFNDSVVVAWMHGGMIELASHDPMGGVIFHTLSQEPSASVRFQRRSDCIGCHQSDAGLGVAGVIVRSTFTASDGRLKLIYGATAVDHRTPLEDRWGGFYVTGSVGSNRHMGNAVVTDPDHPGSMVTAGTLHLASLQEKFDTRNYLAPYSDVAALMVFDHQMHMMNLLTRTAWEIRAAQYDRQPNGRLESLLRDAAAEFADYLLFVDEAPLKSALRGSSGFAERFSAQGPRDSKGRSLRDLDLQTRLLRYPCSYMIYTDAFESLPPEAKAAIYRRMWQILSGQAKEKKYARLTLAGRRAVVEILKETKPGLPQYFEAPAR